MLSLKQLKDVCLAGQGAAECRFLREDDDDYDKHYCLKKRPSEKKKINAAIDDWLLECASKKADPLKAGRPIGDNCKGYLVLKAARQGYDVV